MSKTYVNVKDIVIPAGTVFAPAPIKTVRHSEHAEATLALGNDNAMSLTVPVEDDEAFIAVFRELRT